MMENMIGNPENVPFIHKINELYNGPSELCSFGNTGCRNRKNFITMPYSNRKKLLEGLFDLKMPVTIDLY
jgi:hypothetical protein